jgi:hypothetical protein
VIYDLGFQKANVVIASEAKQSSRRAGRGRWLELALAFP